MHGDRDVVSDRAVGTILIVVSTPSFQLFTGVDKVHELMRVQAFRPEAPIEGVVRGFSGTREVQRHTLGIGPIASLAEHTYEMDTPQLHRTSILSVARGLTTDRSKLPKDLEHEPRRDNRSESTKAILKRDSIF